MDDRPYVANDYVQKWNASIRKLLVLEHVIQEVNIAMSNLSLLTFLRNHIMRYNINNETVSIIEHACENSLFLR